MATDDEDDEDLDSLADADFDAPTPPPTTITQAAWKEASRALRLAARAKKLAKSVAQEQRDRGFHFFGRPALSAPVNPADPGRLGRMEEAMRAHTARLDEHAKQHGEHDRKFEKLDRIQFKIIAAAAAGGIAAGIVMQLFWRYVVG